MPLTLWHRTSDDNAAAILKTGFRDGTGTYMTDFTFTGVWLSDMPLDENEGASGNTLLCVTLDCTEADIHDWEWIEEGKGYREWLIPADFVNARSTIKTIDDDEGCEIRRSV